MCVRHCCKHDFVASDVVHDLLGQRIGGGQHIVRRVVAYTGRNIDALCLAAIVGDAVAAVGNGQRVRVRQLILRRRQLRVAGPHTGTGNSYRKGLCRKAHIRQFAGAGEYPLAKFRHWDE
nr:MAG TPA: hypothetical protein [Caudoviricetes sp.]